MSTFNVVAVSGNLNTPSRTLVLAQEVIRGLARHLDIESEIIELAEVGPSIGAAGSRADLDLKGIEAIEKIEHADLLIAVSPVYRGAYTGLFKHLFDLVDQNALVNVPVILGATGGSERHTLVVEYLLRPLFSFFGAQTVPYGIYGTEEDFDEYVVTSDVLFHRVDVAVRQAVNLLQARARVTPELRAIA